MIPETYNLLLCNKPPQNLVALNLNNKNTFILLTNLQFEQKGKDPLSLLHTTSTEMDELE